jgi:hypothetical protein
MVGEAAGFLFKRCLRGFFGPWGTFFLGLGLVAGSSACETVEQSKVRKIMSDEEVFIPFSVRSAGEQGAY